MGHGDMGHGDRFLVPYSYNVFVVVRYLSARKD
jgi:hypothetical protein